MAKVKKLPVDKVTALKASILSGKIKIDPEYVNSIKCHTSAQA